MPGSLRHSLVRDHDTWLELVCCWWSPGRCGPPAPSPSQSQHTSPCSRYFYSNSWSNTSYNFCIIQMKPTNIYLSIGSSMASAFSSQSSASLSGMVFILILFWNCARVLNSWKINVYKFRQFINFIFKITASKNQRK